MKNLARGSVFLFSLVALIVSLFYSSAVEASNFHLSGPINSQKIFTTTNKIKDRYNLR